MLWYLQSFSGAWDFVGVESKLVVEGLFSSSD